MSHLGLTPLTHPFRKKPARIGYLGSLCQWGRIMESETRRPTPNSPFSYAMMLQSASNRHRDRIRRLSLGCIPSIKRQATFKRSNRDSADSGTRSQCRHEPISNHFKPKDLVRSKIQKFSDSKTNSHLSYDH
ncbi:hypothetical protein MTP99_019272 [Tenebrio molitor]|nr:hypothetical protein MTP99_019272 [Tenebrio molitor]